MVELLDPEIQESHFEAISLALQQARAGLLLSCTGPDFALGASLTTLAGNIDREEWSELDRRGGIYQQVNLSLRRSPVPVVAALRGHVLGAGCELALHCHGLVADANTRMGLVETRAGLLPAAGGIQEMVRRADTPARLIQSFWVLARGRLAGDAREAFSLGYLDPERDQVCDDPSRLQPQAIERLRQLQASHRPCRTTEVEILCGYEELCSHLEEGNLNAYDRELGRTIAAVMCAGQAPGSRVRLQGILDLERQAFRKLAAQPRTRARIRHLLAAGLLAERRDRSS